MPWNNIFHTPVPLFKLKRFRIGQGDGDVGSGSTHPGPTPMQIPGDQLQESELPTSLTRLDTQLIITHIQANDIAVGLGRIPVGFYVAVTAGGTEQRTRNRPILAYDRNIEWNDEIPLPSESSSQICLRVCASFEFSPMLGNGETLRTFMLDIDKLFKHGQTVNSAEFFPPDGEHGSPCSLLRVTVVQRSLVSHMVTHVLSPQDYSLSSDASSSLAQITDEGHENLLRYYKDKKPEDLMCSIKYFERAFQACPTSHRCRAIVLFNLATVRLISCQAGITSPDFDIPITLYRDALDLRPVGHPDRPATLLHLARTVLSRFLKWGDESYAEEARALIGQLQLVCSVDSYEYRLADEMLQECAPNDIANGASRHTNPPSIAKLQHSALHTPDDHPQKPAMLNALAFALVGRFERCQHISDINGSIVAMTKAMEHTQESDSEWPLRAVSLSVFFTKRFCVTNHMEDLERSISMLDKVVQHVPDGHPDRPIGLMYLGNTLLLRFGRLGQAADIDLSSSALDEALGLVPNDHPNRFAILTHVGSSFLQRYERFKIAAHLDRSITLMEEAARCTPGGDVGAFSTKGRLQQLGRATDQPKIVSTRNEILKVLLSTGRLTEYARLVNLGHAFRFRFNHCGDDADLDRAISTKEMALKLTSEIPHTRPFLLADLGHTFLLRYERLGNATDLHNATSLLAEGVRLAPKDQPDRLRILLPLGLSLIQRFGQHGKIVDIDSSISIEEEAMLNIPDHEPNKPVALSSLAYSFLARFLRLGDLADLDKSTSMIEEAVRLTPAYHLPHRARRLTQLSLSFAARYARLSDLSDLNKSISTLEEVVQIVPESDRLMILILSSLANTLMARSERLGNAADLEKSIIAGERAILLSSNGESQLPRTLVIVGRSLLSRFRQLGNVADLDKSTLLMEKALSLMPEGHMDRPTVLISIGISLCCRFEHSGSLPALHSAISYFSRAARTRTSGQIIEQFQAFKHWFQCAIALRRVSYSEANQTLLEAFECAIGLFPQLAWLGLPFKERYSKLLEAADITRSAVSLVLSLGHVTRAIEWLEEGRCVVWGQLLQLRTSFDELRYSYPDIADKMQQVSSALEHSGAAFDESLSYLAEEQGQEESSEQRARRHRELVTERETLMEQIQALPGFEGVFSPKTYSQLRASAQSGPLIVLTVSLNRGDALIVTADANEPIHVPLLDINEEKVEHVRISLNNLLANDGRIISRDGPLRAARVAAQDGRSFNYILSELWTKVVKPVLHALALSTPGKPTRVFWCPTGPLSFLPIHAAGNYDVSCTGNKASDFVISSYVPTLSVLSLHHQPARISDDIRLLTVPQPHSDGQTQLSGAPIEIEHIKETIGRLSPTHVHLHVSDGTVEGVLSGMEQSDWVHFACHGVQDVGSPTDSGLCLADRRRLRLSDIVRLSRPRGGLAFLSACQTATGAVELSEEAVHLSAGMLFAGYSSVVGTMWSIRDSVAPRVAKDVYEQLFRGGADDTSNIPDCRGAARALHDAVERLRTGGAPFIAWVPFIHMGV